jgi:hypothetical protein
VKRPRHISFDIAWTSAISLYRFSTTSNLS